MSATLNKVLLIGRLTRDPELKYTPSGTAVANFGLAINRTYKDANGDKAEDVCFVDVVAWERLAEVASEYLAKGRQAFIEGRLQMHSWEKEDGEKRSKLEIVAQHVQFLDGSKQNEGKEGADEDVPF